MGNFFSTDGLFYKYGTILADIMLVSLLWFVFSLPIVTIGASTTAAYYVCTKRVTNGDSSVLSDFWHSFRRNWWLAVRVFVTVLALGLLAYMNFLSMNLFSGTLRLFLFSAQIVLVLELLLISLYLFPLLARFDMKFTQLFKAAFLMANRHLLTTLGLVAISLGFLFLAAQYFMLAFLVPGCFCFLTSYLFVRVFRRYKPEIMVSTPEDLPPILSLAEEQARQAANEAELLQMEAAAKAQAAAYEEQPTE